MFGGDVAFCQLAIIIYLFVYHLLFSAVNSKSLCDTDNAANDEDDY